MTKNNDYFHLQDIIFKTMMNTKFWKKISNSELICLTTHRIATKGTHSNTVNNEFVTIFCFSVIIISLQVGPHHLMEDTSYSA